MKTISTTDRAILSTALFIETLGEAFAGLPAAERTALRAALEAARFANPLDVALVEIAILLDTASEERPTDA